MPDIVGGWKVRRNHATMLAMHQSVSGTMEVALKEWATVCHALGAGRQIMLLRKGGIFESAGGFEIEKRQFLLFPTYLHQNTAMLKDEAMRWFDHRAAEPEQIPLEFAGNITHIEKISNRAQLDALDAEHIWTSPLIDMRFNYKPQNPLYLLLVRVYALPKIVTIQNTPAYAGCKSWVPLDVPIDVENSTPVMDDAVYQDRTQKILTILSEKR
jgi:hypothetical protein